MLASACAAAQAQSDSSPEPASVAAQRRFVVVPSFSITETLTDNVKLTGSNQRADLITQLSPGIRISSNSGRVQGFFDYTLNALVYARTSESNDIQHALNTAATIEAVENWAFVDVAASVSQQALSAYGTKSSDNALANSNRTEVSTYSLSPYVRGRFGDWANYDARLSYSGYGSTNDVSSASASGEALVRLSGPSRLRAIGWSVDASRQTYDFKTTGTVHTDRLRALLSYLVTPELHVSAIGGRESQNLESPETQSRGTSGWAVDWAPTERTKLSATREQRFFGNSHAISFEHRTPRTVTKYTDSRELSTGLDQFRPGSLGTVYDLLFTQFASQVPDPTARAALVNTFLRNNGIAPNTVVLGGTSASATLVQRRQDLSFAWIGLRDTLTLVLSQSQGERAQQSLSAIDDFANGNQVRQRGVSLLLAHRLTPQSSLNVAASLQNTSGTTDTRTSKLRTLLIGWSGRLGPHTSAALSGRHSTGNSTSEAYTESAVVATVTLQF
jgi:uncharacterized protein (PEP-CTERM system associated)